MKSFVAFVVMLLCITPVNAESYNLAAVSPGGEGLGTAFCIANTQNGSLMITAKHNVEGSQAVFISYNKQWVRGTAVRTSQKDDIASFEVPITLPPCKVADQFPSGGVKVVVEGRGPQYQDTDDPILFTGVTGKDEDHFLVLGDDGASVVQGDSGGPVFAELKSNQRVVVGLVSGYKKKSRRREETVVVTASSIVAFVQTQYGGCPNGFCPIRVRPQIQQPMIGIGIPTGPPRVVGIAEPVTPLYVPQETAPIPPKEVPISQGPQGPPGKDGRSVTREEVESIVTTWLEAHKEELRAPKPTAEEILPVVMEAVDVAREHDPRMLEILARLQTLEKRKITIASGVRQKDGTVKQVGINSYDLDKPIPFVSETPSDVKP